MKVLRKTYQLSLELVNCSISVSLGNFKIVPKHRTVPCNLLKKLRQYKFYNFVAQEGLKVYCLYTL